MEDNEVLALLAEESVIVQAMIAAAPQPTWEQILDAWQRPPQFAELWHLNRKRILEYMKLHQYPASEKLLSEVLATAEITPYLLLTPVPAPAVAVPEPNPLVQSLQQRIEQQKQPTPDPANKEGGPVLVRDSNNNLVDVGYTPPMDHLTPDAKAAKDAAAEAATLKRDETVRKNEEALVKDRLRRQFETVPQVVGSLGVVDHAFCEQLAKVHVTNTDTGEIDYELSLELRDAILDGFEKAKSAKKQTPRSISEEEILDALKKRKERKHRDPEIRDNRHVYRSED
jgi:hypothetical protein